MTARRVCIAGLVLYLGLGATDLALTCVIVREGMGYEANPVAAAWLDRHGWQGLAAFKLLSAAVFGVAVGVIVRHRPRTAAALVALGCAALLAVILHSRQMLDEGLWRTRVPPDEAADERPG